MMKQAPSYKTRGMSNGASSILASNKKDEKSNQTVIFGVVGVGLLLIVLLYLTFGGSSFRGSSIVVGQERISQLSEEKRNIPVKDKYVQVMGQRIFYRECTPLQESFNKVDLLFLHGAKYSSITWKGLGTLQIFASFGYKSIALDLPGFGLSKKNVSPYNEDMQRIYFIENFVNAIGLNKVVIIAPSMAGDYAIPVLMKNSEKGLDFSLNGLIAIAPSGVEKHTKLEYQKVNIPVLVMWGERDRTDLMKQAQFFLPNIPDSEEMMVPRAQHAAFVGNPQAFHSFILKFLQDRCKLSKEDYEEDYDFGTYDWYATNDDSDANYDYNYDLSDMWDSYTDDMNYDYDDENFFFDDQFDSLTDYSNDIDWINTQDTDTTMTDTDTDLTSIDTDTTLTDTDINGFGTDDTDLTQYSDDTDSMTTDTNDLIGRGNDNKKAGTIDLADNTGVFSDDY